MLATYGSNNFLPENASCYVSYKKLHEIDGIEVKLKNPHETDINENYTLTTHDVTISGNIATTSISELNFYAGLLNRCFWESKSMERIIKGRIDHRITGERVTRMDDIVIDGEKCETSVRFMVKFNECRVNMRHTFPMPCYKSDSSPMNLASSFDKIMMVFKFFTGDIDMEKYIITEEYIRKELRRYFSKQREETIRALKYMEKIETDDDTTEEIHWDSVNHDLVKIFHWMKRYVPQIALEYGIHVKSW